MAWTCLHVKWDVSSVCGMRDDINYTFPHRFQFSSHSHWSLQRCLHPHTVTSVLVALLANATIDHSACWANRLMAVVGLGSNPGLGGVFRLD